MKRWSTERVRALGRETPCGLMPTTELLNSCTLRLSNEILLRMREVEITVSHCLVFYFSIFTKFYNCENDVENAVVALTKFVKSKSRPLTVHTTQRTKARKPHTTPVQ